MIIRRIAAWLLVFCLAAGGALADGGAELIGTEWYDGTLSGIQPLNYTVQNNPDNFWRAMDGNNRTVYAYTAWNSLALDEIPEVSFGFDDVTLSEIWIRNGNQTSEQSYFANARVKRLNVTIYTDGNKTATYEYRLEDLYDPDSYTQNRMGGYQRVRLQKTFSHVTQVDFWIIGWYQGSESNYNICMTDIGFSSGGNPYVRPTPTPRTQPVNPYDSYNPYNPYYPYNPNGYPYGTSDPYATNRPRPTATPAPAGSIEVRLTERMATRSGPGTQYDELGSYFQAGTWVRAVSAAFDERNSIWWIQTEFTYRGEKRRAYTGVKRLDMMVTQVPIEFVQKTGVRLKRSVYGYYGPGYGYAMHGEKVPAGTIGDIWQTEGAYVQLEFYDSNLGSMRRVWVPESAVDEYEAAQG